MTVTISNRGMGNGDGPRPIIIEYAPSGPVSRAFMRDPSFVRGIMGPIGSGKSVSCVVEIIRRARAQAPSPDGVRRTRWAVIRNTYPELKSTTLKTWSQWCPTSYGKLNMDSPIIHHIKTADLDMEVLFLALDKDDDVKKLLSLELTGAWINEAREVPKTILDALTGRVGRYPSKNMVVDPITGDKIGATWSGILMDTNPPDDQSWWYQMCENEQPEGWAFFKQPSGLSPEAENIENLPNGYYQRIMAGKDADWIKVYVEGEYGFVTEGKAVYPMFRDRVHTAKEKLSPVGGIPLLLGVDFGLTPSAVIGQKLPNGKWLVIDELVADNSGIIRFAETLKSYVAIEYPDFVVDMGWGDPSGNKRSETDERTALEIMNTYTGWKWKPAPGENDLTMRLEVVKAALNRMIDGDPGMLISPKAEFLRKGFAGGYHYKFISSATGNRVHDKPNKNQYSHPHDALQYLLLGGGEHDVVLGKSSRKNQSRVKARKVEGTDFSLFT